MKLPRPLIIYASLFAVIFSVLPGKIQAKKNSAHISPEQNIESTGRGARAIQKAEAPSANHFSQNTKAKKQAPRAISVAELSSSRHYDEAYIYDREQIPGESIARNPLTRQIGEQPDLARPPPGLFGFVAVQR